MQTIFCFQFLWCLVFGLNPNQQGEIYLDIYNRDQALVREVRMTDLDRGTNSIDFTGVSDGIYGHTIHVMPLKHAARFETRKTSFHYDLLSLEKMMHSFIGRWFTFETEEDIYEGRLLRIDDWHVFLQPDTTNPTLQIVERSSLTDMYYPEVPQGLFIQPTIRWEVYAEREARDIPVEITYLTSDITWMCDYRLEILDESRMMMSGEFTIYNQLMQDFPQATISLIAGDTHRSSDPEGGNSASLPGKDPNPSIGEKLFEHYRFTIEKPIDLLGDQTIQIPFFEPKEITYSKKYVLPHLLEEEQVRIELHITNNAGSGLGHPLPEGDAGIYKRASNDALTFVGEDFTGCTAVGNLVKLDAGSAFDITAHRVRIAQARPQRDQQEETWRVELTNSRSEQVLVHVQQRVFGYWRVKRAELDGEAIEHEIESADRLEFPVKLPPNQQSVLIFTLVYGN